MGSGRQWGTYSAALDFWNTPISVILCNALYTLRYVCNPISYKNSIGNFAAAYVRRKQQRYRTTVKFLTLVDCSSTILSLHPCWKLPVEYLNLYLNVCVVWVDRRAISTVIPSAYDPIDVLFQLPDGSKVWWPGTTELIIQHKGRSRNFSMGKIMWAAAHGHPHQRKEVYFRPKKLFSGPGKDSVDTMWRLSPGADDVKDDETIEEKGFRMLLASKGMKEGLTRPGRWYIHDESVRNCVYHEERSVETLWRKFSALEKRISTVATCTHGELVQKRDAVIWAILRPSFFEATTTASRTLKGGSAVFGSVLSGVSQEDSIHQD